MKHKCPYSYLTINTFQFLASTMAFHILTSLPTFPFFYPLLFLRYHGHVTQCSRSLFKVAFEFSFSENFKRHFLSIRIEILEIFWKFFVKLKEHGDCKFDSRSNYFRSLIHPHNRSPPSPKILAELGAKPSEDIVFLIVLLDFQTFHHL